MNCDSDFRKYAEVRFQNESTPSELHELYDLAFLLLRTAGKISFDEIHFGKNKEPLKLPSYRLYYDFEYAIHAFLMRYAASVISAIYEIEKRNKKASRGEDVPCTE